MKANKTAGSTRNKNLAIVVLVTALILAIPLIAMQFTEEVDWKLADFLVIGALLLGTGTTFVLGAEKLDSSLSRIVLGVVLLVVLILIWAELAVGVFGTPFAGS